MAKPLYSTTICVIIALYLLESATVSSGIGEVCNLGSTEVPETNFLDDGGQYLDLSNRATCTGSLTAWHYCYYAADIAATDTYLVYFRIWRMVDVNNFERIHDYELRMEIDPPDNGETLICETATLDTPLDVQENDILGAYIPVTTFLGGLGLHIIARDAAGFELVTDTRNAFTAFPSMTLNTNNLESRTTIGLHLYADIAIDCVDLADPMNGQVTVTPDVMAAFDTDLCAVATYTCSEGYSLVGDAMRTCQANGQWNGTEPTCEVNCGGLTDPGDGRVTFTPGVVVTLETGLDAVATYTCSEGYSLFGDATRTCQANSQWDGTEPTCMLVDCGGLNDPVAGDVTITPAVVGSIETGLNAVAMYTCNEGYHLVGDTVRTCQENNQWDGAEPTCTLIDCGDLPDPEGGRVTFTPGVVTTIDTGLDAVATYTCNSSAGFILFDTGLSPTRTCQDSGQWSGVAALCTRCNFSTLTDPENGRFGIATTGGDITASYTCNMGYQLVGDEFLTCQSTGQFSGQEPLCVVINCGLLPLPSEGQVDYTSSPVTSLETGLSAMASYSCSDGYDLDGDMIRTCQANGQWNGADPTCMLINCDLLPLPSEGQVDYTPGVVTSLETGLNAMASYSCSEGYGLIGDMIRTCQANGQWGGADPTCMLIDCGGLGDPENGRVIISPGLVTMTGVGAVATYTCNTSAGFMLVGIPMLTCQDSGQWSEMIPECILADCGVPPSVDDGGFNVTMTTFESTAQYGCNEGFTLSGSQSRTCQADGTWSGADPVCVAPAKNTSSPVIAGVVVGLLVAALIALGIIVVIILRRRRQRKGGVNIVTSSNENRFEDLSNPIYSGEMDGRYVGIAGTGNATYTKSNDYDEATGDDAYEMTGIVQPAGTLTSMNSDYDDIVDPHRSSNLVIANPSRMEPQHYELPQRRNIYSTMSDSSQVHASPYEQPVESTQNSYEWGIHVPTKEQREVLTISGENSAGDLGAYGTDENIYAALAEVQRATTLSSLSSTPMTFFEESDTYWAPSSNPSELYEQLAVKKYREIPRNQIQIVEHLGAGQFGTVNKGIWQTAEKAVEIAVKMLKVGAGENDKVKFLQEAAINGQFRHPNIVKLLGVVTVGNPVMMVLEFLANGDLRGYLTKQRPVPGELLPSQMPRIFLGFCRQVACGMEYLSKKAFVHRDLAARNVLVSENKICKISDFGMSRDLTAEDYYVSHGGKVPVKWTAPEALHFKKYTTASDVWSYGAVMYEIWSLGHKPFKSYTNQEAIKLVDDGFRLPPPPGCPKKLYSLMIQCWHPEKSSRPSFLQIVTALSESELELLCWTEKDIEAHPQAMLLGAPLEAGENLYPELQGAYK